MSTEFLPTLHRDCALCAWGFCHPLDHYAVIFLTTLSIPPLQVLTPEEKRFLLFVERGDTASVARTIKNYKSKPYLFDINCNDPLGRSALSIAIINENPEMMDLLLEEGIQVKDALLLAISEEYVEGVESLLQVG